MQKNFFSIIILVALTSLSGCAAIEGIFKAGAVVGIIAVIVVIAIILWLFSLFRGKNQ
jgi:hypothetical protein